MNNTCSIPRYNWAGPNSKLIPCEVLILNRHFPGIDRAIDVKHDLHSMNRNGAAYDYEIIFPTL